jgi:hypothetical protein
MLPHITNSEAGRNKYEVLYKNIFEVMFTLPTALQSQFGSDTALISEHVLSVEGLEALDKAPEAGTTQKFMGTTRTYLNSGIEDTSAEITVKLSLNLRNAIDNYIYKIFRAWSKLGYDIDTGEKSLKTDYTADFLQISIGNRAGDIYRQVIFKDMILTSINGGMSTLDYTSKDELMEMEVKFKSDWWKDYVV